jgi:hypothetical protein
MARFLANTLLPSVLLLSCGSCLAAPSVVHVERFSCTTGPFALQLPRKLPEVMGLARLESMEVLPGDPEEGLTSIVRYVQFPGLRLGLVTYSHDARNYRLSYAEIAAQRWGRVSPLRVGVPPALVHFQLGTHFASDPELKRVYGGPAADVSFVLERGRVAKIRYACYPA